MEYRLLGAQAPSILKSLRKQKGLTQKQLGEKIGTSQRVVARIEANPASVRFERILQILAVLDADVIIRERDNKAVLSEPW